MPPTASPARLLALAPLLAAAAAAITSHRCIHDELQARRSVDANASEPRHLQDYGGAHAPGRRLTSAAFAPIRIKPIYLGAADTGSGTGMTAATSAYLKSSIVSAAIANWQALLQVVPVSGNLFAARACNGPFPDTQSSGVLAGKCGRYSAASDNFCGTNPSGGDLNIPVGSYGAALTYYSGSCSDGSDIATCASTTVAAGTGVADADFVLFVTAIQTPDCPAQGESGTLAYASTCQRDQNDRPTWGRVNFCPYALSTDPEDLQVQINVATHELNHALGFNSGSWPLWRETDGTTPRTPRDTYGDPASTFYYTCNGDRSASVTSESTVAFFAERGMSKCSQPAMSEADAKSDFTLSNCVHRIVTPTVKLAARAHFGCDSLAGAELENHLTTPCGPMGSHWEQRVLNTELMGSYVQHTALISAMTLALHEDSGWYKANYDATAPHARNTWRAGDWGFKQGCAFATAKCLDSSSTPPTPVAASPPHFYGAAHASSSLVCSSDRAFAGYVAVVDNAANLPTQYQYFSSAPKKGGNLDALDYCPSAQPYSNSFECGRASLQPSSSTNYLGETYGASSACFSSTLIKSGSSPSAGAACYAFSCSNSGQTVTVTVVTSTTPKTVTCVAADAGATKSVAGFDGMLTCPDPALLCAAPVHVAPLTCAAGTGPSNAGTCDACTGSTWSDGSVACHACTTCSGDLVVATQCTASSNAVCGCANAAYVLTSAGVCAPPTASATASATATSSSTASATRSTSATASATATGSSTSSATQTAVPMLPKVSASPSPAAGTLAVYGALVFSASGASSATGVMSAFASADAVAAIADSIKAALVESFTPGTTAAAAGAAIGVTVITITDVATGNAIYSVANPESARRRQLAGAAGSAGIKVDFVTQVPPAVSGGAAVAALLAAAIAPSGVSAAAFQAAVVTHVVAGAGTSALGTAFQAGGVSAAAQLPSLPSASPSPQAKASLLDSVPLGAAIGGAVAAFVFAVVVGVAARIVVRRMLGRGGSKVAPDGGGRAASAPAPAARRNAPGSSV